MTVAALLRSPAGQQTTNYIDDALDRVLAQAWAGGFSTKSDFARANADAVAEAASRGFITSGDERGKFGRWWRITKPGLHVLTIVRPQCGG